MTIKKSLKEINRHNKKKIAETIRKANEQKIYLSYSEYDFLTNRGIIK